MDISGWVALGTTVVIAAIAWGAQSQKTAGHGRAIKDLWEKKASAEDVRRVETQVVGIDHWTRTHEEKSVDVRLQISERFAALEKAIEIAMNNHQELLRTAARLESAIINVEKRFESMIGRLEIAIQQQQKS